jgi:hypothetical protein
VQGYRQINRREVSSLAPVSRPAVPSLRPLIQNAAIPQKGSSVEFEEALAASIIFVFLQ